MGKHTVGNRDTALKLRNFYIFTVRREQEAKTVLQTGWGIEEKELGKHNYTTSR
jgi:hypothetical protein